MFPIRDENPKIYNPIATYVIIAINIISWVTLQGMGYTPELAESICRFGLIPGELLGRLNPGMEIPLAQNLTCVVQDEPNWITPLSSMFLHGGWLHIIINMWFLTIFGDNVEDAMGPTRFVVFYLLCGLGAAAAQLWSNPSSAVPMVGASGAIGGVMGGYALLYPKAPVHMLVFLGFIVTRIVVPAYFMLGYWFLLQLLSALPTVGRSTGGVAFWAHTGGFITGIVLVSFFCKTERLEICRNSRRKISRLFQKIDKG